MIHRVMMMANTPIFDPKQWILWEVDHIDQNSKNNDFLNGIPHEAVIDHRRGAYQVVEGVLPLVRVHGTELEHPGDRDDVPVVVPVVVPSA